MLLYKSGPGSYHFFLRTNHKQLLISKWTATNNLSLTHVLAHGVLKYVYTHEKKHAHCKR